MNLIPSKILIVDDFHSNRVALEKLLRPIHNIEVFQACSGEETLGLLIYNHFSLILLDVNMPGMDGYEVAELISSTEAHKHTPIVMLTAHDSTPESILKAYNSGAVDYLTKPIEPTILLNKVQQFVTLDQLQSKTEALKSERELILEVAGQGVLKLGHDGVIQFANSKSVQLINSVANKLVNSHFNEWFKPDKKQPVMQADFFSYIKEQVRQHGQYQQKIYLSPVQGADYFIEITCSAQMNSENTPIIVIFQDITKRIALENKLTHLANYDPLTQLANRQYFHDQLQRALVRAKRANNAVSLLMLDLDHFKEINDTLGHDIGDELLQAVSSRLSIALRETDLSARLGGDEFAILLEDTSELSAEEVARKIVSSISASFVINDKEIYVEASIGIACSDGGKTDKTTLLKWADIALYEAKSAGRNRTQLFIPAMSEQRERQAYIQQQLRNIVEDDALSVHYQPQFSVKNNSYTGVEALVRWPESGYGDNLISPGVFIPIAEQSHVIHDIGAQVLAKSCKLLAQWHNEPDKQHLTISVNLSAKQLNSPNFLDILEATLSDYQFPMSRLILEVTETAIINHLDSATRIINTIKSLGVKLALDDFGTGYSSLNYLQKLPFDIIKIDQCFVQQVDQCHKTSALVKAVMNIATVCNIDVVAEGVETKTQLEHITILGGDKIQGYYFSKPLPEHELIHFLSPQKLTQLNHQQITFS